MFQIMRENIFFKNMNPPKKDQESTTKLQNNLNRYQVKRGDEFGVTLGHPLYNCTYPSQSEKYIWYVLLTFIFKCFYVLYFI